MNEQSFTLDKVTDVRIAYDEENITFFMSGTNTLIIKEYMTANKSRYYAKVTEQNGSIHISEGSRPLFKSNFRCYVEVYVPASYSESLSLHTTSGNMDTTGVALNLAQFQADSTSGTMKFGDIAANNIYITTTSERMKCNALLGGNVYLETKSGQIDITNANCSKGNNFTAHTTSGAFRFGTITAEMIEIETTSGTVDCGKLNGKVDYATTSGTLKVHNAAGSGDYKANLSGMIDVAYKQVTGDISLYNKNDNVILTLPSDLSFKFEVTTRCGSISTTFGEQLSATGSVQTGMVGTSPTAFIKIETRNGSIQVTQ